MDISNRLALERDCDRDPARAARGRVRRAVQARLMTGRDALVQVAGDLDGSPLVVAAAGLADNPATSQLLYPPEPAEPLVADPGYGVALTGRLEPMTETPALGRYIARFCNRHGRTPETLQDGGRELYRFAVSETAIQRPDHRDLELNASEYLLEIGDAPDHTHMEWDNLAHQNYQHLDINEQLVHALLDRPPGRWLLTGLDPEGMDFRLDDEYCRLPFPQPAMTYAQMGEYIKADLREARARLGIAPRKH